MHDSVLTASLAGAVLGGLQEMRDLGEGAFVVFAHRGRPNRYVQFLELGDGLHGESVRDELTGEADPPTEADRVNLTELGWSPPGVDPYGNTLDSYWQNWDDPLSLAQVAEIAARTLQLIHAVNEPDLLEVEVGPPI